MEVICRALVYVRARGPVAAVPRGADTRRDAVDIDAQGVDVALEDVADSAPICW